MVALSEETEIIHKLFQYRFDEKLENHNFGNLLVTALSDVTGSFSDAVKIASRILRIKGEVVPVSLQKNTLMALLDDDRVLESEGVKMHQLTDIIEMTKSLQESNLIGKEVLEKIQKQANQ